MALLVLQIKPVNNRSTNTDAELSEDASAASEGEGHMLVWVVRSWAEKMTQAVTPILKLRGRRAKGDPVLSSLYNVDRPGGAYLV
jgi:hypothetical protein